MPNQAVNREAISLTPSTQLSLFCLDGTNIGMTDVFYFYDGVANNYQPVVFNGVTYTAFPIKMDEAAMNGQGQLVRPKITVSNIKGFVSSLLLNNQSLIGAKFTRTKVFARFIDAVNFPRNKNPYGIPDPSAAYDPDIFYVNRKIVENQQIVQWELASPLDVDGVKLPRRMIMANVCGFKYRDVSCGYNSQPVCDKMGKSFIGGAGTYGFSSLSDRGQYNSGSAYSAGDYVYLYSDLPALANVATFYVCINDAAEGQSPLYNPSNWVADACPYSIAGCRLHFPYPQSLRFGGFPGVSTAPFIVTK